MTLRFELSTETTLDGSYPIVVRSDSIEAEEYVFQFACNIEELKDLQAEVAKGIADYKKLRRSEVNKRMRRLKKALRRKNAVR